MSSHVEGSSHEKATYSSIPSGHHGAGTTKTTASAPPQPQQQHGIPFNSISTTGPPAQYTSADPSIDSKQSLHPDASLLGHVSSVVVVQQSQLCESAVQAMGVPFEQQNRYEVKLIPPEKHVMSSYDYTPDTFVPTAEELNSLDRLLFVAEESDCIVRCLAMVCGVGNLRPLTLHFMTNANNEAYMVDRPFKCGGICCCPLVMSMFSYAHGNANSNALQGPVPIGRVREDFDDYFQRCWQLCCACTTYHNIDMVTGYDEKSESIFETRYQIRANFACCGRINNCCGATCLINDMIWDIIDVRTGEIVANIQKTYAGSTGCCNCTACLRMCCLFGNYALSFPPQSTPEERLVLLTSIFQLDYQLFEKKGGDDG
jgi:hypothetical protein